ncbi:EG45-like domain containing protein [Bidens hawaiensis]|uniref:EG45-like domain containing protein n=1 Tax=Bidens hawaiensis TaxID=980011 RepID=UPI00404AC09B
MSKMNVVIKALILITMVVCLTSVAHAFSGQAIVANPPYVPSRCFGTNDQGVMIAKEHISFFANGRSCGKRYRVRCLSGTNKAIRDACTGDTVDVKVVDRCETCASNELVLSQEAFAKIARLALGRVNIQYEQI